MFDRRIIQSNTFPRMLIRAIGRAIRVIGVINPGVSLLSSLPTLLSLYSGNLRGIVKGIVCHKYTYVTF